MPAGSSSFPGLSTGHAVFDRSVAQTRLRGLCPLSAHDAWLLPVLLSTSALFMAVPLTAGPHRLLGELYDGQAELPEGGPGPAWGGAAQRLPASQLYVRGKLDSGARCA